MPPAVSSLISPVVSINGHIASSPSESKISVFDRGFTMGDGIFETIKVSNLIPWYLGAHLERMRNGARVVSLDVPHELETWIEDVMAFARESGAAADDYGVLRITLTRGLAENFGFTGSQENSIPPTVVISLYPTPKFPDHIYRDGLTAHISNIRKYPTDRLISVKSTSYAPSVLATLNAQKAGYNEAIMLDPNGFVSEAASSNIFLAYDGKLRTPDKNHGILSGITRQVVIDLSAKLGFPALEKEISVSEIQGADEVFLTSSIRGIVPIVEIDGIKIGQGTPGTITKKLMAAYQEVTDRELSLPK